MRAKLRKSGIDIIGDIPWGTHFCQFYQTKEDLMDILVPYFKAGLENNEFCIWITSKPLEVGEAKEALRRAVPYFDVYLDKRQIEIIPYTCGYMNDGVFDSERVIKGWGGKLNQALENGYDGLRATGDTCWLEKEDWSDFVNYEKKIDSVIYKHQMIALCPYHLDMCSPTEIIEIASNHQFSLIKRAGKWERIENSGRQRAEEAVYQAAKDWEQTFDAVPDLIAIIDNECRVTRANRAIAVRLGMTPEECVGLTCYRAMHGTDEPPSFCPHKQLLEDGIEYITEVHEDLLGGDFLLSVSPLYDSDGKLTGCVHVARDITKRKQMEESLRQSEERERARSDELAILLDAVPAAVWVTHDPQALQITGNRLSYEWLRLPEGANASKSAPVGERPETFTMFRDGVELQPEEMPVQMSAAGTELRNYEFDIVYLDGTKRHILGNARPLRDEQGNPIGSVSAFIDITEHKKAEESLKKAHESLEEKVKARTSELEEAYKALMDSEKSLAEAQRMAHLGNWDWNIVTNRLYWSDESCRIFGLDLQEFGTTYESFLSYVHPDDRNYLDKAVKEALNGKPYEIDYRIISADGENRIVHAHGEVIFNEEHIPVRMRGTVQNITERKKAEEALEKIQEVHIKEIHHRIKNNLQVISSLLSLEAERFSDAKMLEAFRESQNRVASMALIHEELYKGNELDTLDFAAYLQKLTADLFGSYNLSDNISLKLDLEQIHLGMDTAIPLGIILNELVSNSLKHAFPSRGAGEIHITLCKTETFAARYEVSGAKRNCLNIDHFHYMLTVADKGTGIPEEMEFPNTDSLGLQLVNILVEQLDGFVELKRNKGTEFTIWFNDIEP